MPSIVGFDGCSTGPNSATLRAWRELAVHIFTTILWFACRRSAYSSILGGAFGLSDVEVLDTVLAHELSYALLRLIGVSFVWPTINVAVLSLVTCAFNCWL